MTCKDCLHFKVCEYEGIYFEDIAIKNSSPNADVRDLCPLFENQADFVEVVRCKDCECFEPHGNGKGGICRNRKCKGIRYATDFCSYGGRKEK